MLPAGQRDRRIVVQRGTSTQSSTGEPTFTWDTYFETWAHRRPLTGREFFQAQQVAAQVDVIYRIPYPDGKTVTPVESLRIIDAGVTYDVRSVAEIGKRGREGLEIMAAARAETGN
jgi:SPP1 family predicted phage head-tail adaptor